MLKASLVGLRAPTVREWLEEARLGPGVEYPPPPPRFPLRVLPVGRFLSEDGDVGCFLFLFRAFFGRAPEPPPLCHLSR